MKYSVPLKIFHFHNGSGGGVLSVIRNLLAYRQHPEIENHVIYTINKDQVPDYKVPDVAGAISEQVFYYSPKWNFYYTCRQLAKLLPDDKAVIVAHDWLELGMVSNLGLQNPVVQFLHGNYDYYFDLSKRHSPWINTFITIAGTIKAKLLKYLPNRADDIHLLNLPVPDVNSTKNKASASRIVFIGRCEPGKGYPLLPQIAKLLIAKGRKFEWHIIGEGSLEKEQQQIWPLDAQVYFHGLQSNKDLLEILPSFDFLLLPSLAEGMPLTVIEAMKAGVIPVVNDLPGGLQEIIRNGETGFLIKNNEAEGYVQVLVQLQQHQSLTESIAANAIALANQHFDPLKNTEFVERVFIKAASNVIKKPAEKKYGSRLDQIWLPNSITTLLRSF